MTFLLDTHTLLWMLFEPDRLSEEVQAQIKDFENEILVSPVSLWEISLKFAIGKLELKGVFPEELLEKILESGLSIISFDADTLLTFHKLPQTSHKDPFDRLIVWQAIKNDFILISKDKLLSSYEGHGLKIFW